MSELLKQLDFMYQGVDNFRTVTNDEGTWFCLVDVCKPLGIKNIPQVKARLDSGGICTIYTPRINVNRYGVSEKEVMEEMLFINEPNLYRVIFASRKEEAVAFQNWIFDEVIPMINKHRMYIPDELIVDKAERDRLIEREVA